MSHRLEPGPGILASRLRDLEGMRWARPPDCRPGATDALGLPVMWRANDVMRRYAIYRKATALSARLTALLAKEKANAIATP